ncbi:MAG: flagellar biosynthesis anti-sigma factor FlgM [Nitrosospira sp.]
MANVEVFDAVKVEEIKRAISEGRFTVNPDKVADGLLDTVRDLIHRGKG